MATKKSERTIFPWFPRSSENTVEVGQVEEPFEVKPECDTGRTLLYRWALTTMLSVYSVKRESNILDQVIDNSRLDFRYRKVLNAPVPVLHERETHPGGVTLYDVGKLVADVPNMERLVNWARSKDLGLTLASNGKSVALLLGSDELNLEPGWFQLSTMDPDDGTWTHWFQVNSGESTWWHIDRKNLWVPGRLTRQETYQLARIYGALSPRESTDRDALRISNNAGHGSRFDFSKMSQPVLLMLVVNAIAFTGEECLTVSEGTSTQVGFLVEGSIGVPGSADYLRRHGENNWPKRLFSAVGLEDKGESLFGEDV